MMKMLLMAGASAFALSAGSAKAAVTFNYSGSVVDWSAPTTGMYMIDVYGAQGGQLSGGLGIGIAGEFHLTAGETLEIAVGGRGGTFGYGYEGQGTGGGGGGSFVTMSDGTPLIVAGGGGGGPFFNGDGGFATAAQGSGQGGAGYDGAGGGGFFSYGANGYSYTSLKGAVTTYGGGDFPGLKGGAGLYAPGGFGGGGGSGYDFGGGGGGFGGGVGGGGYGGAQGGGGSSFNAGLDQSTLGFNYGDGLITISAVPEPSAWSLMLTGLGFFGYILRRRVQRLV